MLFHARVYAIDEVLNKHPVHFRYGSARRASLYVLQGKFSRARPIGHLLGQVELGNDPARTCFKLRTVGTGGSF
jgi:hypothetical protein